MARPLMFGPACASSSALFHPRRTGAPGRHRGAAVPALRPGRPAHAPLLQGAGRTAHPLAHRHPALRFPRHRRFARRRAFGRTRRLAPRPVLGAREAAAGSRPTRASSGSRAPGRHPRRARRAQRALRPGPAGAVGARDRRTALCGACCASGARGSGRHQLLHPRPRLAARLPARHPGRAEEALGVSLSTQLRAQLSALAPASLPLTALHDTLVLARPDETHTAQWAAEQHLIAPHAGAPRLLPAPALTGPPIPIPTAPWVPADALTACKGPP